MYFHFLMYVHDHRCCLMTTCVLVTTKEVPKWKIYLPTSCMTSMTIWYDNGLDLINIHYIEYIIHVRNLTLDDDQMVICQISKLHHIST
ncbi:hypothetical protein Hanom_Chr10g00896671 [Helianthus anomalus]